MDESRLGPDDATDGIEQSLEPTSDIAPGADGQHPLQFDDEAPTRAVTSDVPQLTPLALEMDHDGLAVRMEPRYEWSSAPADADPVMSFLLTLTPEGPPLRSGSDGPAAHLILALDLSASMNHADKYPVLTQALEGMIAELQASGGPDVLLSIVVFAYGAETLLRAVPVSAVTARDVLTAIDRCELRFGRYTDIVGALSRAGRIAYDGHKADPALPVRIVVMTDGRPQDVDGAGRMMGTIARMPVDVDALAFGADANVDVLKDLFAGRRGGTVKHVRSDTLGEAYERIGEVARNVVAKRSLLEVTLGPGVVGGSAFRFRPARHAYGKGAFRDGVVFETDLGSLESGRSYSLLFQVRLPQTTGNDTEIGSVRLRVPGHGGPREYRCALAVPRHAGTVEIDADPVVVEARHVLEALEAEDPEALLKALRTRRKLYISERRDPYLLEVVDKAIAELETAGTLAALSRNERAALTAHTATAGSGRPRPSRREFSFR
jgi:hypothetical protein